MHKPHTMNPQLLKAVSNGDADLLAQILSTTTISEESRCACLGGVTAEGSSALHIAARHGYLKLVEMICDQDISLIKARNNLLDTPLICASRSGHVDVVDYLIQLASTQRDTEYVLRAWNSSGATAVHEAVRNGHASVLGKLVSRDARLAAAVDGQGVSPLYMAVVSGRADMVDILISESRGGSVKLPASYAGPDGQTALHAAVFARNAEEMCESLQRWEPTLAQKADSSGRTALHYAASSGKTGVVKLLLVNSLLAYIPDDDGLYPVHYAAIAGNSEVIHEIMEICPSCDELVDKKQRSILHCAVESGRTKVVRYICRNPMFASIMNAGDDEGNTPPHLAVKHGNVFSFGLLMMDLRVNLGIINHKGLTPLDVARNGCNNKYSFSTLFDAYICFSLFLCEAYSSPFDLEDEKESSRYYDMSHSILCLSVLIAAGSFAAAFTPPGDYITDGEGAGMPLFEGESYFFNYVAANSMSFYLSTIATCLLMHASLATTPGRDRHNYLVTSVSLVSGAIVFMFLTFTNVVRLALDPQNSWRECLLFYFISVVELLVFYFICLPVSVLTIHACFRTSKHPWHWTLKVLAIAAAGIPTSVLCGFITEVISVVKRIQPGKQESCSWPGCHDAIFLHPT
ncbi:protein ACCELERATED CELL DEATH 6-like [Miscanthus floridulus]|uniref:protein ACCELERATED CELL DEATH 6-like n=1 Tax=Miscanthus floridulus TaxID=154761 RepID=UPI0034594FBC